MNALRVLAALFDIDTAKAETKLKTLESGLENTKQVLASVAGAVVGAFAVDKLQDFIEERIEAGSVVNIPPPASASTRFSVSSMPRVWLASAPSRQPPLSD